MKKLLSTTAITLLTSSIGTTAFADTIISPPPTVTVSGAITQGVAWMNKNAMSTMHDWSVLADFAATDTFQNSKWTSKEITKLKVTTDYARFILALLSAGLDPHAYQGQNFVSKLAGAQLPSGPDAGKFADNPDLTGDDLINVQAWTMIALEDAGHATYNREAAISWLKSHQNSDGGWGYSKSYSSSDPDDTASAVVALTLCGVSKSDTVLKKAEAYLKSQQAKDGGFGPGEATNSDSTGVVMDALQALGVRSNSWAMSNSTPADALLALFDKQSGGFNYDNSGQSWSGVSGLSTRDALIGLGSYKFGTSVYQRLHWRTLNELSPYWKAVQANGGVWISHEWKTWSSVRYIAVASTYSSSLNSYWSSVAKQHGVFEAGKWMPWNNEMAQRALVASFGLDSVNMMI